MTIRGKWSVTLLVVLVVSLALNLFVAGFAVSKFRKFGHGPVPGIERMFSAFVGGFPREIRRDVHDELEDVRPQFQEVVASLRNARTRMFELMREDPLDKDALAQAMTEVRDRTSNIQQIGHDAARRAIENASPEARAKIDPRGPRWRRHSRWN